MSTVRADNLSNRAGTESRDMTEMLSLTSPIQRIRTIESNALGAYSVPIPQDDTVPQITEGTQVLAVTITPTASDSIIVLSGVIFCAGGGNTIQAPIFNTDVHATNAVANAGTTPATVVPESITYRHEWLASALNGTAATTFTLRIGHAAGNYYLNSSATMLTGQGGIWSSHIMAEEFVAGSLS